MNPAMYPDMTRLRPSVEPHGGSMASSVAVPRPPRREPESVPPPHATKWAKAAVWASLFLTGCAIPCTFNALNLGDRWTPPPQAYVAWVDDAGLKDWGWYCDQHRIRHHVYARSDTIRSLSSW